MPITPNIDQKTLATCTHVYRIVCAEFNTTAAKIQSFGKEHPALHRWIVAVLLADHTHVDSHDAMTAIIRDHGSLSYMRTELRKIRGNSPTFEVRFQKLLNHLKAPHS